VQIADLIAYTISWGWRTATMTKPKREELDPFAEQISAMRYCSTREMAGISDYRIWSFAHITDLRTRRERVET